MRFGKNDIYPPRLQKVLIIKRLHILCIIALICTLHFSTVSASRPSAFNLKDSIGNSKPYSVADSIAHLEYRPSGYIKTNLPQWLLFQSNVTIEFDVAPHWSVGLPIIYCGMDWFTYRYKFRTFAVMPSGRYWIRSQNQGFFVGAHFGMGWFDFAFGGTYRYQDKHRHTPALGGGLSFGYRKPISRNGHWWFEAELGCGVYKLSYDRFINVKGGAFMGSESKVVCMPDIVSLSIVYRFDLKKGGKR